MKTQIFKVPFPWILKSLSRIMGDQITEAILTKSLFNEGEQPGEIAVTGVIGMLCLDDMNLKNTCLYLLARLFLQRLEVAFGNKDGELTAKTEAEVCKKISGPHLVGSITLLPE